MVIKDCCTSCRNLHNK